jgi:hypothetical protein
MNCIVILTSFQTIYSINYADTSGTVVSVEDLSDLPRVQISSLRYDFVRNITGFLRVLRFSPVVTLDQLKVVLAGHFRDSSLQLNKLCSKWYTINIQRCI